MKDVSTEWQAEIKDPNRTVSLSGRIWIKEGDVLVGYDIPEAAVVANSLTITDQLNTGKVSFGSVYLKNLSVKIDYTKVSGLQAKNINLTNAQIRFNFTLHYPDGTSEMLRLENFLIDSTRSSRRGDILSIYGVSCMSHLDITAEAMTDATPYQIYKKACNLAKIRPMTTEEEFATFPNYNVKLTFDTKQIKSARDMLMWVADLTCTNAFATVDYSDGGGGVWAVKLVQIPTKYTQGGTTYNFDLDTFKADNGTVLPANIRYQSEFTDTSIRVTTVSAQNQGETIIEHRDWNLAADTLEGSMEIEFNALLENVKSDETALQEWIYNTERYVEQLRFCPFKTKFLGNPAIEVGDFVYLEPGGDVDDTDFRHYGIVTYSKWTYPDTHEIRCATDLTAERPDATSTISTLNAKGAKAIKGADDAMSRDIPLIATLANDVSTIVGVPPKSQLEKKVNAMSGGGESDSIVSSNGSKLQIVTGMSPSYDPNFEAKQAHISVGDNGSLDVKTKCFFLNLYPGNIYLEAIQAEWGIRTYVEITADGVKYIQNKNGNTYEFKIEPQSGNNGQDGGTISFGNQSIGVRNGVLYINGSPRL